MTEIFNYSRNELGQNNRNTKASTVVPRHTIIPCIFFLSTSLFLSLSEAD